MTAEEQDHPHYQPPNSCPHCYVPDAEKERVALAERQAKLDSLIDPLPGSVPYDNRRPFTVPGEHDGATLGAALLAVFPYLSREHWQTIVDEQRMVDSAEETVTLNRVVRAGEYYAQLKPATTEPAVDARVRLLYEDEAIVVLSKPSPLPMHPGGRFKRNTLDYLLTQVYSPHHPRPAHRLDANTSGLVVCSRTRRIAGLLQPQFTEGKVEKTYLARVHGKPTEETFSCATPIGTEVGPVSYLGIMVAGFPNMYTITGPGSPSVLCNMIVAIEQHLEFVADSLGDMQARGADVIEADPEAETAWVEHGIEVAYKTLYPKAASWYMGANIEGKPRVFMPYIGGMANYAAKCRDIVSNGYTGFVFSETGVAAKRA